MLYICLILKKKPGFRTYSLLGLEIPSFKLFSPSLNNVPVLSIDISKSKSYAQKKKSVRKVKTDSIDANRIAQVFYLDKFCADHSFEPHIQELKSLCRQYDGFNDLYVETQNRLRSVLDLYFPLYETVFAHLRGKTALRVLALFPSPDDILSASHDELFEALKPSKKSVSWCESKINLLILAAKESLPLNQAQASNVRILRDYIELLLSQQKILADLRLRWFTGQSFLLITLSCALFQESVR